MFHRVTRYHQNITETKTNNKRKEYIITNEPTERRLEAGTVAEYRSVRVRVE